MHFSSQQSAVLAVFMLTLSAWGSPIPSTTSAEVQDGYVEYHPRAVKASDIWKRIPESGDIVRRSSVFYEDEDLARRASVSDDQDIQERDLESRKSRGFFGIFRTIGGLFNKAAPAIQAVSDVAEAGQKVAEAGSAAAETVSNIKNAAQGNKEQQQPQQRRSPNPDPNFKSFWNHFKNGVKDVVGFAGDVVEKAAPIAGAVMPYISGGSGAVE